MAAFGLPTPHEYRFAHVVSLPFRQVAQYLVVISQGTAVFRPFDRQVVPQLKAQLRRVLYRLEDVLRGLEGYRRRLETYQRPPILQEFQ